MPKKKQAKSAKPKKKKEQLRTTMNKAAMIIELKKTLGNVTESTKRVGIDRQTHYDWVDDDKEYAQNIKQIPDHTLDFVETALMQNVKDGNVTAQIFYLKTKGKARGYVEKQEIEHTGADIKIEKKKKNTYPDVEDTNV